MINFGTSAYLKLIGLNAKPRDTELRKRLFPKSSGGYDFHKRMRLIVRNYLTGSWTLTQAINAIEQITASPERASAQSALQQAIKVYSDQNVLAVEERPHAIIVSPRKLFSVKFEPDIKVQKNFGPALVHLWNTRNPAIGHREVAGLLGLFGNEYEGLELGVTSLRTGEEFLLASQHSFAQLATNIAIKIENRLYEISIETEEEHRRGQSPNLR